jgi:Fic family protein
MKYSDFGPNPSGNVIQVTSGDTRHLAFVPDPLPPHLDGFEELWEHLESATYAVGQLAGLGRTMTNPTLFIRPFIRKEAVLSSKIEGTQTEFETLMVVEAKERGGESVDRSSDADTREVLNYVAALEYGLERCKTLPLSLRLLRETHERLLEGVRGENKTPGQFRTVQNWIGPRDCKPDAATFVPPPVDEMKACLRDFEAYLHDEGKIPRLVKLAYVHYQFEAIHPFMDGNGRIGRLLLSLLTCHWDLLPVPLLYLSAYFERNRDEYYDRLLAVSTHAAWSEWIRFFLAGVVEQANDAVERAKQLQDLQVKYREQVGRAGSSAALPRIVEDLFAYPIVSVPSVGRLLDVSYQSAKYSVAKLVDEGILRELPIVARPKLYAADAVLKLFT